MLSDSESENGSVHRLTINEHYAKAFEYKKEREELAKLKEKYGSDFEEDDADEETDSESDEDEDEDGEELTPAVDAAILRTLARIKRKDPEIYNAGKNIFGEEQQKTTAVKVSRAPKEKVTQSKPVTLRQVALQSMLESDSRSPSPEPLPHIEEQRVLRDETIAAFHHAVDEQDDGGLLIPRERTKDEQEREEEEYRAFLEREVGGDIRELVMVEPDSEVKDDEASMGADPEGKSKQEADQEFLMNYIFNRGWIDRSANHIPTYQEITTKDKGKGKARAEYDDSGDSDSDSDAGGDDQPTADPDLDEDDFEEIVDRFESSYNFRFEEPGHNTKEARKRRKERKEEELLKKKEDVKRIRAKLERIGREGGKDVEHDQALQGLDLEGEWDPDAHDKQMAGLYGDDDDIGDEKPQWEEDIDIGDIPISDEDVAGDATHVDDGVDIDAMDADIERIGDDDEWDGTEEMRKRKLDEYMDEIYGLDLMISFVGDMPTRFKYVPVQPQSFALSPVEILMATDQELNEYMSVKKYAPYRKARHGIRNAGID
ncbi:KRI1-like family C-terminal-domain-containing protein [Infundibulicybe gibba]|nr:KRI1-like family C-terminal-domain-containing protein [Infundibulicybe gibba]